MFTAFFAGATLLFVAGVFGLWRLDRFLTERSRRREAQEHADLLRECPEIAEILATWKRG